MKLSWLFVVVLLLANFTLIESARGALGAGLRRRPNPYVRRRFYRPKSGSYRRYYTMEKIESKNQKARVETPPQASPDVTRSLHYVRRLNYLAANKKEGKSNIGRILSGS